MKNCLSWKPSSAVSAKRCCLPWKLIKFHSTPPKPKLNRVRREKSWNFVVIFADINSRYRSWLVVFSSSTAAAARFRTSSATARDTREKMWKSWKFSPRCHGDEPYEIFRSFFSLFRRALNNVHVVRGPFSVDFCSSNLSAAFLFSFVSTLTVYFLGLLSLPQNNSTTDIRHHHNLSSLLPINIPYDFHSWSRNFHAKKNHLVFVTIKWDKNNSNSAHRKPWECD